MNRSGFSDPAVYNWRRVDDRLVCSGQPDEAELALAPALGIEAVVNLGMRGTEYALPDEAAAVRALGMDAVSIPVPWRAPSPFDLDTFLRSMAALRGRRVWVHCAANKRASVFMAVYLRLAEGWGAAGARALIDSVWTPDALWEGFYVEACRRLDL